MWSVGHLEFEAAEHSNSWGIGGGQSDVRRMQF